MLSCIKPCFSKPLIVNVIDSQITLVYNYKLDIHRTYNQTIALPDLWSQCIKLKVHTFTVGNLCFPISKLFYPLAFSISSSKEDLLSTGPSQVPSKTQLTTFVLPRCIVDIDNDQPTVGVQQRVAGDVVSRH